MPAECLEDEVEKDLMMASDGVKGPRESLEGNRWVEEVKDQEDKALLNLITQTAKLSSYNNVRRQTEDETPLPAAECKMAVAPPTQAVVVRKKGPLLCCGGPTDVDLSDQRMRRKSDPKVLRDPTSKVSYNIEHLIGEGGFSKVLLVRAKSGHIDTTTPEIEVPSRVGDDTIPTATAAAAEDLTEDGTVYAAKIIPKSHLKSAGESFIKATMLERNILGKFHHPFLLKLYHAFQERDRLILVVDYCPGGSLHTHVNISLRENGTGFDEDRAAFYVSEIALAIAHLHKHGIVHRDLKLENVLMYRAGHCAVSDFGASKRIKPMDPEACTAGGMPNGDESMTTTSSATNGKRRQIGGGAGEVVELGPAATHTKSIVGTPAYMAPEMLLTQPYDFSVDWWALGVVLFTMLKGRLPFDAPEEEKMLWRIVKSKPRYDPNWSQPLLDVLRALLQKRPTTRLSSLRALSRHDLYRNTDWRALENLEVKPPYVPSLETDSDTKYLPKRIAETALPTMSYEYKKGDSMKKLFRKFSHRGSFDASLPNLQDASSPQA